MVSGVGRPRKLLYGLGDNDADYLISESVTVEGRTKELWRCPYYTKWKSMLMRCYSESYLSKNTTYKGCSVCEEWLLFSNFRAWMEQQDWEGRCLDKDFLLEGNKIYSPSTCVFLPQKVNTFIITSGKVRGDCPLGVSSIKGRKKNPYYSQCCGGDGGQRYLGRFSTSEQAHQAWLMKKFEICNKYLEEFKDEELIVKGLTRIKDKIQHHIKTNTELTSF